MRKNEAGVFYRFRIVIRIVCFVYSLLPKRVLKKLLGFHRNMGGNIGYGIRYCLMKNLASSCGENVAIDVGVFLLYPENMSFGNNVSINPMCYLSAFGGLYIGDNVSIAHRVTIMTSTHNYDNPDVPIRNQGISSKSVYINNNTWIGAGVTILAGTTIGSGSIIGANSLLTKDVPINQVWGGIPAKYLKSR